MKIISKKSLKGKHIFEINNCVKYFFKKVGESGKQHR
jgi:hypothetical protein